MAPKIDQNELLGLPWTPLDPLGNLKSPTGCPSSPSRCIWVPFGRQKGAKKDTKMTPKNNSKTHLFLECLFRRLGGQRGSKIVQNMAQNMVQKYIFCKPYFRNSFLQKTKWFCVDNSIRKPWIHSAGPMFSRCRTFSTLEELMTKDAPKSTTGTT